MTKAKDFQQETAERIIEIFRSGQKRVLLSDEVGLGKTIIARTVIEKAINLETVKDDEIYRVVYVCSNQNIIRQNISNLGVKEGYTLSLDDSRLSMQHLILQEQNKKRNKQQSVPSTQLIPITPATSFNITNGDGNAAERALIFAILKEIDELKSKEALLSKLIKTDRKGDKDWERLTTHYDKRVYEANRCETNYLINLHKSLKNNSIYQETLPVIRQALDNDKKEFPKGVINKLRIAFSQISIEKLNPDLVIMDEFQRFSDLLNIQDDTEEAMVAKAFFNNPHPYILLLSATPYKPFTTLEELNEDNNDTQYKDFLKLMEFLFPNKKQGKGHFTEIWKDYSCQLSQISNDSFDTLIICKRKAETKMYEAICRTERFRKGLITETSLGNINVTQGDILAYCQFQQLLQNAKKILDKKKYIDIRPSYNLPIEYVKSSPYLLSFMQNYQESKTVRAAFGQQGIPVLRNARTQKLLIKESLVYEYKALEPNNAKLEALQNIVFKHHAERLLWIPASHPYYKIPDKNVFAQNHDFSKVLVFSAWEMVPRMLAVMLSYESERKNVGTAYKKITYKNQKKIGMNRLQKEGGNLLIYPSEYLSNKYDYKKHFGKHIEDIVNEIEAEIQADIDRLSLKALNDTSAEGLLSLIKLLEKKEDTNLIGVPSRAAHILAYMAIGSPGVCFYRIMKSAVISSEKKERYAELQAQDLAENITALFNRRESSAAVELITAKGVPYYEQVLHYCVMGNLQAVLDEYCHIIDENNHAEKIIEKINQSFISASPYRIETTASYCKNSQQVIPMRRNFAFDYAKVVAEKSIKHNGTLQQAFNSPFRPFVLSTTSIGQEGLDFHWYARKIVHWNLPSNPVDMEQREGRINRYKCLAIRRNIAKFFGNSYTWTDMFNEADREWRRQATHEYSEMVPCWCIPPEIIEGKKTEIEYIERIVPIYPMSIDRLRYEHLKDVLSLYRLTMGQPHQEELLKMLEDKVSKEQMQELLFDLSPYSRNKKIRGSDN